jgi:hypothetical protein
MIMMLNPGQLNSHQGGHGLSGNWSQAGAGFGPNLAAYGNAGQNFGAQNFGAQPNALQGYGFNGAAQGANLGINQGTTAIDDIADDIADRIASEIADQAATGAAALFQAQVPQAGGQSLGGLNVKRWLNAARVTDTLHDTIKQHAQQLCRQVIGHLLTVLQAQWSGAGQHGGQQFGAQQFGAQQFGGQQFGAQQFGAPGQLGGLAAAYGGGQPFGQQNVAQLAPVVAAILGMLQSQGQGQGFGQGAFGQAQYGAPGRLF